MIAIAGVGWVQPTAFGSMGGGPLAQYDGAIGPDDLMARADLFPRAVKNFGRFPAAAKLTCAACSLALRDAGLEIAGETGIEVGCLATGRLGCLDANEAFFRDYVHNGRQTARGNLFIYTLPTAWAAEASICLNLRGPGLFIMQPNSPVAGIIGDATKMVGAGEADAMLAVWADGLSAVCFAVAETSAPVLPSAAAGELAAGSANVSEFVDRLRDSRADD